MNISASDNLRVVLKKHVLPNPSLIEKIPLKVIEVVEVGQTDSYQQVFTGVEVSFLTVAADTLSTLPSAAADVIVVSNPVASQARFSHHFAAIESALSKDGILIVARNSVGLAGAAPDALLRAAAEHTLTHVETWQSPFGSSFENVAVFKPATSSYSSNFSPDLTLALATPVQNSFPPDVPDEVEHGAGTLDCYEFLIDLHKYVEPRFYTEIGVEYGASLKLATCAALGIDPAPQLSQPIASNHSISYTTSDDFFRLADTSAMKSIDLCYIDGMHQIEFALKDFMNMERFCHAGSVVIVDDIYPAHPLQGERIRQSRYWTGDIWKIIPILQLHRPDLIVMPIDTDPTGSLMVLGLDPNNDVLWDNFDEIIAHAIYTMTDVPDSIVQRVEKFDPRARLMKKVFKLIRKNRDTSSMPDALDKIRDLISRPKLRAAK